MVTVIRWLLSLLSSCYCCGSRGCCDHFVVVVVVVTVVAVVAELAVVNCYCCYCGCCRCCPLVIGVVLVVAVVTLLLWAMVAVVVVVAVVAELAVIVPDTRHLDVRTVLGVFSDIIAYCMLCQLIFYVFYNIP